MNSIEEVNIQKKYLCFSFYDLYCIHTTYNLELNFSGCSMDYYTHHEVVKLTKQNNIITVYTNRTGILCKQSKLNDKLRWKIFRDKRLCKFMQIFENIIINKHLQAIWLSYNRKYLNKVIERICYYFSYIETGYVNKNLKVFITEQINHETLEKIIQYIYRDCNIQISDRIKNKSYSYSLSENFLGKNFYVAKTPIGIKKFNNNIYAIKMFCDANNYYKILKTIDQRKNISIYIKNINIKILIQTNITKKYFLGDCRLNFSFIIGDYYNKNIYTVLI